MRHVLKALIVVAASVSTLSYAQNLDSLFEDVGALSPSGWLGAVTAVDPAFVNLISDDDHANIYAIAREFGNGRVLVTAHEAILTSSGRLDNDQFVVNALDWLGQTATSQITVSTGHGEWAGSIAADYLADLGRSVDTIQSIYSFGLGGTDVLVIGNAWQAFLPSEIDAIEAFVANGGGVWLAGQGWSLGDQYPSYAMHAFGQRFGFAFLSGFSSIEERFDNWPVLRNFYPDIPSSPSILEALETLSSATNDHGVNLELLLSEEPSRNQWLNSVRVLMNLPDLARAAVISSQLFEDRLNNILAHPQLQKSSGALLDPLLAYSREFIASNFLFLDPDPSQATQTLGLEGDYREIHEDHGVYLADNARLSSEQLARIDQLLGLVPASMFDLDYLSVADFLGSTYPFATGVNPNQNTNPAGFPGVNIFGINIGGSSENPFPADVDAWDIDIFSVVLAHELNHRVDVKAVSNVPENNENRNRLIQTAGGNPENYLRSMASENFFVNAPQEFFASISNQWFANSDRVFELAMARFDAGIDQPLEQALFFADVYSEGRNDTWFYRYENDAEGWSRRSVALSRDASGGIDEIQLESGTLIINRSPDGTISGYQLSDAPPAESFSINQGMTDAWFNPFTGGQGFYIIVYPDLGQLFVGWFTYDLTRSGDGATPQLGDTGHRWLTAQGAFSGPSAELTIYQTAGGVFDAATPEPTTDPAGIGTMLIEFADCENGLISYTIPGLSLDGEIPIQRIALDNVALCEDLLQR